MQDKSKSNQSLGQELKNWQPRKMPDKTFIQGCYCLLETIDINKHSAALFETLLIDNQGELWTYLPYGPFVQLENFQQWLKETLAEKDTRLYAVLDPISLLPIGITGFLRINPAHGVIEVGHLHYSALLKRTPAATEAMYLMMKYAFDELGYRRYEWKCNSLNQASRNAALRLGFQFEGIFRQCNVFKNHNRDTVWFSIIDSEWPTVKERLEKWLHANNFDAEGKQKTRLERA